MRTASGGYETPGVLLYHPFQPAATELLVSLYWKSLMLHVYHISCVSQILVKYLTEIPKYIFKICEFMKICAANERPNMVTTKF